MGSTYIRHVRIGNDEASSRGGAGETVAQRRRRTGGRRGRTHDMEHRCFLLSEPRMQEVRYIPSRATASWPCISANYWSCRAAYLGNGSDLEKCKSRVPRACVHASLSLSFSSLPLPSPSPPSAATPSRPRVGLATKPPRLVGLRLVQADPNQISANQGSHLSAPPLVRLLGRRVPKVDDDDHLETIRHCEGQLVSLGLSLTSLTSITPIQASGLSFLSTPSRCPSPSTRHTGSANAQVRKLASPFFITRTAAPFIRHVSRALSPCSLCPSSCTARRPQNQAGPDD